MTKIVGGGTAVLLENSWILTKIVRIAAVSKGSVGAGTAMMEGGGASSKESKLQPKQTT